MSAGPLARGLHPAAWWGWALGLAVAASRVTNPIILALIGSVVAFVVTLRRTDAPWALAFTLYVKVGLFIIAMRVAFRVLFNGDGATVLFTLPRIQLPQLMAGVQLLGPVSLEALLSGFYDGLRLAVMIVCIGGANALANPKRLLAAVPGALYEIGTVVVVALSVFPQLAESVQRINRARVLRSSGEKGRRWLREVILPVLADSLDRSLLLAAAMDSRGYGRRAGVPAAVRRVTSVMLVTSVLAVAVGVYAVMDHSTPWFLGAPMLVLGALIGAGSLALAGRRAVRTRYRPDVWRLAETLVLACGVATAALISAVAVLEPDVAYPSLVPLAMPTVSLLALVGVLVGALPAVLAPPPPELVLETDKLAAEGAGR